MTHAYAQSVRGLTGCGDGGKSRQVVASNDAPGGLPEARKGQHDGEANPPIAYAQQAEHFAQGRRSVHALVVCCWALWVEMD